MTDVGSRLLHFTAQVRWSDPDRMGHINHTRYLTYVEEARLAFLAGVPRPGGYVVYSYPDASNRPLTEDERAFPSRYVVA